MTARASGDARLRPYLGFIWPALVVGWFFWIPGLSGIYAMPQQLQFVLFLFVEAAWSLIIIHVAKSALRFEAEVDLRGRQLL